MPPPVRALSCFACSSHRVTSGNHSQFVIHDEGQSRVNIRDVTIIKFIEFKRETHRTSSITNREFTNA